MAITLQTSSNPTALSTTRSSELSAPAAEASGKAAELLRRVSGDGFGMARPGLAMRGGGYPAVPDPRIRFFPRPMPQDPSMGSAFQRLGQCLQALAGLLGAPPLPPTGSPFEQMVSSIEQGTPLPNHDQLWKALGDRQKAQLSLFSAAKQSGTPPPNVPFIDAQQAQNKQEFAAFNMLMGSLFTGAGGPSPVLENEHLAKLSPEHRQQYLEAKACPASDPNNRMLFRTIEGAERSSDGLDTVLETLKLGGPGTGSGRTNMVNQAIVQNWSYLTPTQRAQVQQLRAAAQPSPFQQLVGAIEQGVTFPNRDELWNALDDRQKAQVSLFTAAKRSGTPAANASTLQAEQGKGQQEFTAFAALMSTLNTHGGGPSASMEDKYLNALTPEHRQQYLDAKRQPRGEQTDRALANVVRAGSRQAESFNSLLETLKLAGNGPIGQNRLLDQAMAQSWQYLSADQKARFNQLKTGTRTVAPPPPQGGPDAARMELLKAEVRLISSLLSVLTQVLNPGVRNGRYAV